MKDENFAAVVIVPTADSHASEYIADHFKTRQWLSGFTGSAGTLVVGDGRGGAVCRWHATSFRRSSSSRAAASRLMRMGTAGTPTLEEYLAALLRENDALGVDFRRGQRANSRRICARRSPGSGALLRDTGDWFGDLLDGSPGRCRRRRRSFWMSNMRDASVQNKVAAIRKVMERARRTAACAQRAG